MAVFRAVYNILWGDIITIPLPGGSSLGLSLLVIILVPAGLYPFRLFPEMLRVTLESNKKTDKEGISGLQALIVSTACRVGMGNLVGVVAAISAGGAGAVFWERYSGCGSSRFWGLPPHLLKPHWHRSIRKKIPFTADTGAARHTIFIGFLLKRTV